MKKIIFLFFVFLLPFHTTFLKAQKKDEGPNVQSLRFRSIGPALTSGRIADFAVNPDDVSEYYVASAAGGVWKTINNGITFKPVFDHYGSHSIGCLAMAPDDPNTLWVGTGENNNQRSVDYGDGIYKSLDGGKSFKNMGLKKSEHIGRIVIAPNDPNTVYVAAIGPLWKEGGERGVYKTVDGGAHWEQVLKIDEHTGVNDIVMDPRNPDVLYAASYQRRRHVFTYLGGGPKSAIYKTMDGGKTWEKLSGGLPKEDIGRIGLGIAPSAPDHLYAIVEAARGKGGFFLSLDGGNSWQKQSSYNTSGNYYQEIYIDPTNENRIFAMDTWLHVSMDAGKHFRKVNERYKHVDNHCMWINPDNPAHWRVGCDGGVYESYDDGASWTFKDNLPVTQLYKLGLDNDYPFYHVYGGTQDNFSLGGPTRTPTAHGILNCDWYIVHGGDGFQARVDPENPNIVYASSQYGVMVRFDRSTGEEVVIQPLPDEDEPGYKWNWDAPFIISHHDPKRLYFAANKVFRSDDRGSSWKEISEDLSAHIDRNKLKVMGRVWSVDAVAKNRSTSPYGEIVALDESPLDENILIVGTDDGLIWTTEDGGKHWRKISRVPGAPERSYVNDLALSAFDKHVFYAVFNHHKYGDFKPYIFRTSDFGNTWQKITGGLPDRGSVFALVEDHKMPELLFCGTEFGAYYSDDTGMKWHPLKGGLPTISIRDLEIQKREDDLVLASFGRGFYVLDDYSPLRKLKAASKDSFYLFKPRNAYEYEEDMPLGLPGKAFQGDGLYSGENLGPSLLISYFVKDAFTSLKKQRIEKEKKALKEGKDTPYPDYEMYKKELREKAPELWAVISDLDGNRIAKVKGQLSKGLNRIKWDMRFPAMQAIRLKPYDKNNPFNPPPKGTLVPPGSYQLRLYLWKDGIWNAVSEEQSFDLIAIDQPSLPVDSGSVELFKLSMGEMTRKAGAISGMFKEAGNTLKFVRNALAQANNIDSTLYKRWYDLQERQQDLRTAMYGDNIKQKLDLPAPMPPMRRLNTLKWFQGGYYGTPLKSHWQSMNILERQIPELYREVKRFKKDVEALNDALEMKGYPYTPHRN